MLPTGIGPTGIGPPPDNQPRYGSRVKLPINFLPVSCPVCHVIVMCPITYSGDAEVTVTLSTGILAAHADYCRNRVTAAG